MGEIIVGAVVLLVGQITGFSLAVAIANSRRPKED